MDYDNQFSKFQVIELNLIPPSSNDKRPESRKIEDINNIINLQKLTTGKKGSWEVRKQHLFKSEKIFTNKAELLGLAYDFHCSLAFFKPTQITDFVIEDDEREWPQEKVQRIIADNKQLSLFSQDNIPSSSRHDIVEKIPYKFSY